MEFGFLSLLTILPLGGVLLLLLMPSEKIENLKWGAFGYSVSLFLISLNLLRLFDVTNPEFQLKEGPFQWIPQLDIQYHVAIDGISLFLILLTTFIIPIVILAGFSAIKKRVKEYLIFILTLETAMIGTFCALNLFVFYIFWELMLIPMYFIIGIYGSERRIYATIKFFLYTMFGSLFMLAAIIAMGLLHRNEFGVFSVQYLNLLTLTLPENVEAWLFAAFFLAFAIKVPMFPFHTWLPDAHVEAPTGGSVILAAVLLKMGTYGMIRFLLPLFPHASQTFAPCIMALGVIGIIYGALMALAQKDMKKLVAYSSVSHMGYVVLGIFSLNDIGLTGAIYQMLNHGLATGALFLLVGILYEQRHTKLMAHYGGIAKVMPKFAVVLMIATLSSVGLPGLNGFVGEFYILSGTFVSSLTSGPVMAILAATGIILGAVYMLTLYQNVALGPIRHDENKTLTDVNSRECAYLLPLVIFIFAMGIFTTPFTSRIEPTINKLIHKMELKKTTAQLSRDLSSQSSRAEMRKHEGSLTTGSKRNSSDKNWIPLLNSGMTIKSSELSDKINGGSL